MIETLFGLGGLSDHFGLGHVTSPFREGMIRRTHRVLQPQKRHFTCNPPKLLRLFPNTLKPSRGHTLTTISCRSVARFIYELRLVVKDSCAPESVRPVCVAGHSCSPFGLVMVFTGGETKYGKPGNGRNETIEIMTPGVWL